MPSLRILPGKLNIFLKCLFTFFIVLGAINLYLPAHVRADVQAMPDPVVPCLEDTPEGYRDPEFHSLRPYQASPCPGGPVLYFCNNDYIIEEDLTREWDKSICDENTFICDVEDFIIGGDDGRNYRIGLSELKFPILGNTQNVINSQQPDDEFDAAQKMNEYANWYLQGVTDKAEYGNKPLDNFVSFAGPYKKLVPWDFQNLRRHEVLHDAGVKEWFNPDSTEFPIEPQIEAGAPTNPLTGEIKLTKNHNQIAVCTDGATDEPVPCYDGTGNWVDGAGKTNGSGRRLNTWWEAKTSVPKDRWNLPPFNAWDGSQSWGIATPPYPWLFSNELYYQKAWNEWRGQTCNIVGTALICTDGEISLYAKNYRFIPLGNSIDKDKKHELGTIQLQKEPGTDAEILSAPVLAEPILHYPHTESTAQVSEALNFIHTPLTCDEDGECKPIKGFGTRYEPTTCEFLDVRTNPGDDLNFDDPVTVLQLNPVMTEVREIQCENQSQIETFINECGNTERDICETVACDPVACGAPCGTFPQSCTSTPDCEAHVNVVLPTVPKIPYGDALWKNTVVGKTSPFRRIFPQLTEGAPVSCIDEIPGVSGAYYNANDETNLIRIVGPGSVYPHVFPGAGAGATSVGEIYFPHQGTILEYFLHGIQTALRPLGYGNPIVNGDMCSETEVLFCGDIDVPDSAVPAKYLGAFKENFISMADNWTWNCKGPENNLAEECYNYVVSNAEDAGINGAFALTIWLNESGASNYCFGGPTTQDMGMNISAIYMNLVEQLKAFINFAKVPWCAGDPGFSENMHGWLSRFQSSTGVCNPADPIANQYYLDVRDTTWTFVAGSQCVITDASGNKKFAIDWPTDKSCPP